MDRRAVASSSNSTRRRLPAFCMDPKLWSLLPEEVLITVVAWLPLLDLAQLRSVCKKWNALWYCRDFLKLRARVLPQEDLWYCFNGFDHLDLTPNCKPERVARHSLCYLPKADKKVNLHTTLENVLPVGVDRIVATGGGLILLSENLRYANADRNLLLDLLICNPLKKDCWKKIPERRRLSHVLGVRGFFKDLAVGMIVDTEANSYKVVIASIYKLDDLRLQVNGRRPVRGSTEIYDSVTNTWEIKTSCMYPNLFDRWNDKCETVGYQGYLFAHNFDALYLFGGPNEEWVPFPLPVTAAPVRIVKLEECQGRMILVGTTTGDLQNPLEPVVVHVWEIECRKGLPVSEGTWRELSCVRYQDLITRWPIRAGTEEGARFFAGVRPNSTDLVSCIFNNSFKGNPGMGISLLDFDLSSSNSHPYNLRSVGEALLLLKGDSRIRVSLLLYSPSQNTWCLAAQDHTRGKDVTDRRGFVESSGPKVRSVKDRFLTPGFRFQPRIEASV